MGDYKMECPGCGAWTNSVGLALRDGEPCPHCGLSAEATQAVIDAQARHADTELTDRLVTLERELIGERREASAGRILVRELRSLLDAYDAAGE